MFLKRHLKRPLLPCFCLALCLLVQMAVTRGEASSQWQRLETKRAIIQYKSLKDLKKFDSNIDYSPGEWSMKSLFGAHGSSNTMGSIRKKVDALFERVQKILEMYGEMKKKVVINVYSNKEGLHRAYYGIAKRKCRIRAWYIYERNTIYINVNDVFAGMLAHEMAHSIIDHYLLVRPPRASAEILARYVDTHLYD